MFEFVVLLVLVLINGLFSGAEIALLSVRQTRVQELIAEGRPGARSVAALRSHPEQLLATVQIGITVVGSTAAAFGGSSIADPLALLLAPALGHRAEVAALAIVVASVSFLSLVLGELVPKSLALRSAEPYALLVAPGLTALAWVGRPLVWLLTAASNLVLGLFGDRTSFVEARLSQEELSQLLGEATTAGTVDEHAGNIAVRALAFSELTAGDVLVPRGRIVSVAKDTRPERLAEVELAQGHSRILVHGADADDILGYVNVRRVLASALQGQDATLATHLHPVLFVPISMPATSLLRDIQRRRVHLAVVVDELGTLRGLVSLEDLVEELVGEILSEGERAVATVTREADGRWLVNAATPIRDVDRALGLDLPEVDDATTLAGLVTEYAERIPEPGERVRIGNFEIEVVEATRRRVQTVRIAVGLPEA